SRGAEWPQRARMDRTETRMPGASRGKGAAASRRRSTKASGSRTEKSSATQRTTRPLAPRKSSRKPAEAAPATTPPATGAGKHTARPRMPGAQHPGRAAARVPVHLSSERLGEIQAEYLQRLGSMMSGALPPEARDRRFAGEAWKQGPFAWAAGLYQLNAEFMHRLAEAVEGDKQSRNRIRFAIQQWVDAMSPANFLLTNPEAQRKL